MSHQHSGRKIQKPKETKIPGASITKDFETCRIQQHLPDGCTTNKKNNILDVFFTNCPTFTTRSTTVPRLGDHDIVIIVSNASVMWSKPKKAGLVSLKSKTLKFQKYFKETFTTMSSVNTMWANINNHLLKC